MFDARSVDRPYPGLRPFEPHEGEIFFGRDSHIDRLLEILQRERFLAIVGASGSGKSSLVRAGLLPALAGGRLGTGSHWRLALLRPGAQPLLALAQALTSRHALGIELAVTMAEPQPQSTAPLLPACTDEATADAAVLAAELRRGPDGLDRLLAQAQAAHVATHVGRKALPKLNLLVLVDQFEEVFTYRSAAADPDEAQRFVAMLLHASGGVPREEADPDIRVVVALTMRTDFLGHCVEFNDLPEAINRAQYLTPRLRHAELQAAIVGPARLFEGDVEPGFAEATVADTGTQGDQLPLLQHALAQWWLDARRVTPEMPLINLDCTRVAGTMREALNRHAELLYTTMSVPEQQACEWLFRAITTGREGADAVRRPQRLKDIAVCSGAPEPTEALIQVVRKLATPEVSFVHHGVALTADSVIDLTHEALIRQWHRLADWVSSELRRAQGWHRWRARAAEYAAGEGSLLAGAELARALDWWDGEEPSGIDSKRWTPTAAWCRRYATATSKAIDLATELGRLREFLLASRNAVRHAAEAERTRLQDDAKRLERERGSRRLRYWGAVAVAAGSLMFVIAWVSERRANQESEAAVAAREVARGAALDALQANAQAEHKLRLVSLLTDYWLGDSTRLDEALAADTAIRKILSGSTPIAAARRQAITLEIFAKDIDQGTVRAALAKLGFKMAIRTPNLAKEPTNAVWAGTPVAGDDTRLVALGLIRAGIAVRSIGPIQEWIPGRERNVIQAGAAEDSTDCRPWKVAEVVAAPEFTWEARHFCS
jgi:hypothetical protein